MSLDTVIDISITRATRSVSRAGFGTGLIARYHTLNTDRVRTYSSEDGLLEDGFKNDDPAYLIAQKYFSQDPRPPQVKVGRRNTAPAQIIELTPSTPSTGLAYHCTVDGDVCEYDALVSDVLADVCTAFAKVINTAEDLDADAIKTNGVSTAGTQTILAAALDGVIGDDVMDPPRSLRFVFDSHTDWDATAVVVTGTNSRGDVITETFTSGSSVTAIGVKLFASVTSISIPAQTGTGGTYTLGVNARVDRGRYDAIIETGGSTAGIQTLTGASLNGFVGALPMTPSRALVLVISAHTDWNATTAVVHGTDANDMAISENFAIPADTGATVKGTKLFKTVTSVVIPAQTGTNGKFTLGYQARMIADGSSATKVVVTTTTAAQVLPFRDWRNTQGGTDTLSVFDATADAGIAADLALINAADSDWYGLLIDTNSKAEILAAAAYMETKRKLFVAQTADSACLSAGSTTDVMASVKTFGYARTNVEYHPSIGINWMAAAHIGNRFPKDPGSESWSFNDLAGIEVYALTETEESVVEGKFGTVFIDLGGWRVTQGSKNGSGEFIDIIRLIDWTHARLQETSIRLLASEPDKLPYDDGTVAVFVNAFLAVLAIGVKRKGFLKGSPFCTGVPVAEQDPADRAARLMAGFEFGVTAAGAVNRIQVRGRLSV